MLWKRLNTETDPKVPLSPFPSFFQELSEIHQKLKSIEGFPNIFDPCLLYIYIWFVSRCFIGFLIFWVRFRFSEKVLNSPIVDRFPLFFDPFPHFLGPFLVFRKSFKFLFCWSVSSFFRSVFLNFCLRFRFSEKVFKFSVCWLVSSVFRTVSA